MTASRRGKSREGTALTIGVLLSIGIGALFYFLTNDAIANATFAALLGTMVALQIENMLREQKVTEKLSGQQRLIAEAESIEWLPGQLDALLNPIVSIEENYHGTTAMALVQNILGECVDQMKSLQQGRHEVPFEDNWLLYELTRRMKKGAIRAVSIEDVDLTWWSSADGKTYWDLNVEAIERKVCIERIFVYRNWTDEHEMIARQQHEAKVAVRWVDQARLRPDLLYDMIIWGGECGFRSSLNAVGGKPTTNNYTFAKTELEKMIGTYNIIRSCSEIWIPSNGGDS